MPTKQDLLDSGARLTPTWVRRRFGFLFRPFPDHIFIHIPKTGGTSIEQALHFSHEHKWALEKRAEMGRLRWNRRFSFTIVRNPWDRLVSYYFHELTVSEARLAQNPVPFSEWIRSILGEGGFSPYEEWKYSKYLANQWDWITDRKGNVLVDFVARFERLQSDFDHIGKSIGQPHAVLPHLKRSNHDPDYRVYYDEETRKLVESFYSDDIHQLCYNY